MRCPGVSRASSFNLALRASRKFDLPHFLLPCPLPHDEFGDWPLPEGMSLSMEFTLDMELILKTHHRVYSLLALILLYSPVIQHFTISLTAGHCIEHKPAISMAILVWSWHILIYEGQPPFHQPGLSALWSEGNPIPVTSRLTSIFFSVGE